MGNEWITTDIYPQRYIFNNLKLNTTYDFLQPPFNLSKNNYYDFIVSVDNIRFKEKDKEITVFDNRTKTVRNNEYSFRVNYVGESDLDLSLCSYSIFVIAQRKYHKLTQGGEWKDIPRSKAMEVKKVEAENPSFTLINKNPKDLKFFIVPSNVFFDKKTRVPNIAVRCKKTFNGYEIDFGERDVDSGKQQRWKWCGTVSHSNKTPIRDFPIQFELPDNDNDRFPMMCHIARSKEDKIKGIQPLFLVKFFYKDGTKGEETIYYDFEDREITMNLYKEFPQNNLAYSRIDSNTLLRRFSRGFNQRGIIVVNSWIYLQKPTRTIEVRIINPMLNRVLPIPNFTQGYYNSDAHYAYWFVEEKGGRLIKAKNSIVNEVEVVALYE